MGFAGTAAKIATKPGVLGAILGGAGGVGIMSLLGGVGSTEQTTTQQPTGGTTYNTTHTPTYNNTYDYSQRNQTTTIIDSPFASASPDMSGGIETRTIPTVSTKTDARAAADATTGTGLDMLSIALIGGIGLAGVFLLSGGGRK